MHAYTYDYTPPRPGDRRGTTNEAQTRRYRRIGGGRLRGVQLTREQRSYNAAVRRNRRAAAKAVARGMKANAKSQSSKIQFPDWVELTLVGDR